ncbi:unnamed protein product, partial [marine sediment metagenome]
EARSYFEDLIARGFELKDEDLPGYLFSCVGKVAEMKGDLATVMIGQRSIRLKGIVVPRGIDKSKPVAIHFAVAFSNVSDELAEEISAQQAKHSWFRQIVEQVPTEIDYSDWCGSDLSQYTKKQIHSE